MKKFICYIPLQVGSNLRKNRYINDGNPNLKCDFEIRFPISAVINGYVQENEKIMIIALMEEDNDDCLENFEILKEEISGITKSKNVFVKYETVLISKQEKVEKHLNTFQNLINKIEDNDELFSCITFGTKPTPLIQMLAMQFAYKNLNNVNIGCIVYGKVVWVHNQPKEFYIYDVTPLFSMSKIIDNLSNIKNADAKESINFILGFGDDNGTE